MTRVLEVAFDCEPKDLLDVGPNRDFLWSRRVQVRSVPNAPTPKWAIQVGVHPRFMGVHARKVAGRLCECLGISIFAPRAWREAFQEEA